jgi:cyanobactin biosynthesis protein (PatB/AcyB/McaB family)
MNDIPLERGGGVPMQSAPVKRPEIIPPHAGVELVYGAAEDLVRFRMYLIHGANFNDPPAWRFPSYETLKTSGRS